MAVYIITNTELVAIANAIRSQLSSSDTYSLNEMVTAIASIGISSGSGATTIVGNNTKYLINADKIKAIADAVRTKNGTDEKYLLSELPQAILDIVTITYTVNYYNGSTLLYSETVTPGSDSIYSGTTPTKASTAQYSYTFIGWSKNSNDNTVDNDALSNINEDRNVYACFTETLRTYTVTFIRAAADGGGTLQTLNGVAYGTILTNNSYTGSTPTTTQGSEQDYAFLGWTPNFSAITGNTTYTAKFDNPIKEITDSWDQIIANIDNGTYNTKYKIGNYKPLDLGTTYGTINMQIVAIDGDDLARGGKAPITFLAKELLLQKSQMNSTKINTNGYPATNIMKPLLDNIIYPLLPSRIQERVQEVNKTYYDRTSKTSLTSIEKLWIPSHREIQGYGYYETQGIMYNKIYPQTDNTSRKKTCNGTISIYWLRTADSTSSTNFRCIDTNGSTFSQMSNLSLGIALGFCLGLEPETITDSWETILSNTNPSATYSIGDTKSININGENHLMQIVAFDADEMTDGGTAKISWLMKDLMNVKQPMHSSNNIYATQWSSCDLSNWLNSTVLSSIDSIIQNYIVQVKKTWFYNNSNSTNTSNNKLWIPSSRELFGTKESTGIIYTYFSNNKNNRIKKLKGINEQYFTRTNYNYSSNWIVVTNSGDQTYSSAVTNQGVCIGFCTN